MKAKPLKISAPEGSVAHLGPSLDPELREALEDGRTVCAFARNSGTGKGARVAGILDAQQLVDDLARFGLDVRHLMPPAEKLDAWLKAAVPQKSFSAKSGKPFSNRFVEVWLAPNILLGLSVGTGSGISEETISQPFMDYVNERVTLERPVLLMGKRWDRLGRRRWGLGPSFEVLKVSRPGFLGDEDGLKRIDETTELLAFIKSGEAERFADRIPRQTRRGMRSRTGDTFEDGCVAYALTSPPPPGLCRLRMLSGGVGANGEVMMYLESPRWLPPKSKVALGYPAVLDPSTEEVVDQVENVRWALQRLADPAWTLEKIGEGLRSRRFSHTAIRERYGLDALVVPETPDKADKQRHAVRFAKVLKPIISNLDFYESGTLVRTLGVEGMDDVAIEGIFPLDGPWASPETFTRIRKRLREVEGRRKNTVMHLTGLEVTVDGSPYVLRGSHAENEEASYALAIRGSRRFPGVRVRLPHAVLARVIAEALDSAVTSGLVVPSLEADYTAVPEVEQAGHNVQSTEILVSDAQQRSEVLFKRMMDDSIAGAAARRIAEEYNTLLEETIPGLERELRYAVENLNSLKEEAIQNRGLPTERLDYLIRALAEPFGKNVRKEVDSLVHSLSVNLERHVPHRNLPGYIAHITVELALLDQHGDVFVFLFENSYPLLGAAKYQQQLAAALEDLRDGSAAEKRQWLTGFSLKMDDIARILDLDAPRRHVLYMKDGRLQRVTFAVIEAVKDGATDEAATVAAIAVRLGEPAALVARCWDLYGPTPSKKGRWQNFKEPRDRTIRTCPHGCGVVMLQSRIDEIHSGVCPEFRRDIAGVHWDERYDQWLVTPETGVPAAA